MVTEATESRLAGWGERLQRQVPALLCLVIVLLYLPSLAGGYLPYDDDWLIEHNGLLEARFGEALQAMFLDLSKSTRLKLGAEYLPLRDLSHWCEVALFGKSALGMRLVQLMLYVIALLLLQRALERHLSPSSTALAVACFAVHPTHVESVAWLAGRKDVLALLFIAAALACYVRDGYVRWFSIPLVVAAALSKSMSVVCPGLLLALDLVVKRRPAWGVITATAVGAGLVFLVHVKVGASVGMVGGQLGESRAVAFWTMGEVWLRYLTALIYPPSLSIIYDVAARTGPTLASVVGWLFCFGSLGYATVRAFRGETFALGLALWVWLPLLPVSQVFVPLQNVMADRYLWLTTLALGLLIGGATGGEQSRVMLGPRIGVVVIVLGVFTWGTAERAALFGDPVALFEDATRKSTGPRGPYQLGYTLAARGELEPAIAAYRLALERECDECMAQRNAANNLALLLVRNGEAHLAEPVLRRSVERFPDDAKTLFNLVKVLARVGKEDEAEHWFEIGKRRFPLYLSGDTDPRGHGVFTHEPTH